MARRMQNVEHGLFSRKQGKTCMEKGSGRLRNPSGVGPQSFWQGCFFMARAAGASESTE